MIRRLLSATALHKEGTVIRINKYLSQCGVTSRRGAEALIGEGRVSVNGEILTELGTIIEEGKDQVAVDGEPVEPVEEQVYIVMNKPAEVMTTLRDPFRRKTVARFLKGAPCRVYPVGRLDYDTEGVLLLTNDGDLAYRLTHPKYEVPKVYEAKVDGKFGRLESEALSRGVKLEDGAIGKAMVSVLEYARRTTRIRLTLTEGRKREVKQLCALVGHPVKYLERVEFAGITAKGLARGKWRQLSTREVDHLRGMVGLE